MTDYEYRVKTTWRQAVHAVYRVGREYGGPQLAHLFTFDNEADALMALDRNDVGSVRKRVDSLMETLRNT